MNFRQFLEFSIEGLDADGILAKFPKDFEQQAELDKKLHNMAIGHGTFGTGSGALQADKNTKSNFQLILAGNHDKNLIRDTIARLRTDQKGHTAYITDYPESERTGDRRWHTTWMNVYDKWIGYLQKLMSEN